MERFDVVVLGAGAAGMMCAAEAGGRGRRVLVVDGARAAGEKIRISGGGRCNFTHLHAGPENFISANPRFAVSALRRYTPRDFTELVERAGIAFHEKSPGQLFCDGSALQVVDLLKARMAAAGVVLRLSAAVEAVERAEDGFVVRAGGAATACGRVVVATGGRSIPKMGATGIGYDLARRYGVDLLPTRPGLVPLTFEPGLLERLKPLAGVSAEARIAAGGARFEAGLLFTHRGLSGPSVLQVSSYWREGEAVEVDLLPGVDAFAELRRARAQEGRLPLVAVLARRLPRRLAEQWAALCDAPARIGDAPDVALRRLAEALNAWRVKPVGSEGWRTAEVTLGGVDTAGLDPRTFEARAAPGLHFIGEVVDVTGWLGGYNFQWAWSSGWCCGQAV